MLALVPEWLLRLVLGYAVKWLYKKVGLDVTVDHIGAVVAKVTPLPPDPLPSPKAQQGPIEKHYEGNL